LRSPSSQWSHALDVSPRNLGERVIMMKTWDDRAEDVLVSPSDERHNVSDNPFQFYFLRTTHHQGLTFVAIDIAEPTECPVVIENRTRAVTIVACSALDSSRSIFTVGPHRTAGFAFDDDSAAPILKFWLESEDTRRLVEVDLDQHGQYVICTCLSDPKQPSGCVCHADLVVMGKINCTCVDVLSVSMREGIHVATLHALNPSAVPLALESTKPNSIRTILWSLLSPTCQSQWLNFLSKNTLHAELLVEIPSIGISLVDGCWYHQNRNEFAFAKVTSVTAAIRVASPQVCQYPYYLQQPACSQLLSLMV
jgi:hypothetical protein